MKDYYYRNQKSLRNVLFVTLMSFLFGTTNGLFAQQLPECGSTVPFFTIDLSSDPDSTYTTPEIVREGLCCGGLTNQNYVSFYVTLHPDVAMIEIGIVPGYADPGGSGNYNIITGGDLVTPGVCGPDIPGGQTACITGSGPHKITYHKPGKNKVKYYLRQIPKPIYPQDDTTRVGCSLPLNIFGLDNILINSVNSSSGVTTYGAFNSLLSCTNCSTPSFSPGLATPEWIDYQICGSPQASVCGVYQSCDTVRLYTADLLELTATPNPAEFCAGGGVLLTSSAVGGDGIYTYSWYNSSGGLLSSTNTYNATVEATYTAMVADGLTSPTCPAQFISIPVVEGQPPVVNAGPDLTVCAASPNAFVAGSISNASGGIWSGGAGIYTPNSTSLMMVYTPTSAEINSGSVELILSSTGAGGGCANDADTMVITFSDTVFTNPIFTPLVCNGDVTTIDANASGGTAPYTYAWSTGDNTSTTNVSAGTYTVTVSDIYGCSATAPVTVSNPAPLILTMSSTNTSTDIACDGTASVAITGGVGPYSVLWSNAQTTLTATGYCYGIATVTVTDANGCVVNGSVVVNNPTCSAFSVSASNTNVECYGDTTAQAFSFPSGGTPPYSYAWNTAPVQTTQNATGLGAGTYTVAVTDNLGCIDVASVTILQPTIITNTMTHVDVTTIGGNNGSATANPAGGTPGYTYLWNPTAQLTQTATNLTAGVYYVNIQDANSCLKVDSVQVNEPPCNDFMLGVNPTNISCNGLTDGSAYIVIAQGTPPYSISWSSGEVNVTSVSGLAAGSYTVTVTDASNCTTFETFDITEPDALTIGLVPTNISCYGAGDGTIDLTVSGGTFPYTYTWTQGVNTIATHEDLSNLKPGTYSVMVKDANGCTIQGSVGITQPVKLGANYTYTDVVCNGDANGSVDATPSGGTLPYFYSWTGPAGYTNTSQDISGLDAGLYELEIIDGNGCILSPKMQAYVNEPDSVIIVDYTVPCPAPGANDVVVSIDSISGGSEGSFQVSFDGGSTYGSLGVYTALLPLDAAYTILAKDSNGCVSPIPAILSIDPKVEITGVNFNPCVTVGTDSINVTVTPSGGDGGPYDVSTDGGITFGTSGTYVVSLAVGNSYNLVIRDSKGCNSVVWPITLPEPFDANAVLTAEASCPGAADGSIDLTVLGGTSPYMYSWTGPAGFTSSLEDISGLIAGTYDVTVTDDSACVISTSINVTTTPDVTPPVIVSCIGVTQNEVTDIGNCTYLHSGTAWDATATDNCLVSSVVYDLSGATTGSGTSLDGVTFNLGTTTVTWTVTDGSGNTSTCNFDVVIADNQLPAITSCGASGTQNVVVDTAACTYTHSGTAWDATATDNCTVSTLVYTLSGATTGSGVTLDGVVFNLGTTTVTWTVTDGAGNTSDCNFDVVVSDDQLPVISSCGGVGTQTVIADPGVCTYTHSGTAWNATATDNCTVSTIVYTLSGATTGTGTNLNGVVFNLGTTTVTWTVTDGAGNSSTCNFDVDVLDTELPAITSCGPSGSQTVNANLGTCTYTYSGTGWNATATDNCTVSSIVYTLTGATAGTGTSLNGVSFNLGVTTVTWTVTDGSGNSITCSFSVTVLDDQLPSILSCGAVGTQNMSTDPGACTYTNSGTAWDATAADNCSIASITYVLTGATAGSGSTLNGVTFAQGTSTVTWTAMDGSGNSVNCSFNVVVTDNENPVIVGCPSDINVNNDNGNCAAVVSWTPPSFTDNCGASMTASHTPGATFPVGTTTVVYTVTDGTGNTSTCSFNVVVTDAELPQLTCSSTIESCDSLVTFGAPAATDNCGVASVTQIAGLPSGSTFPVGTTTVTFEAIDIHGNSNTCSFDVIINPTPVLTTVSTDVDCFGNGNGSIDLTVTTGTPSYTYTWSNGATTQDISSLQPGIYGVTVVDANGCSASTTDTIAQPNQLLSSAIISNVSCHNGNDGTINLTVNGGVLPYDYVWNNGATTEDISLLTAGNYNVVVTDANGCQVTDGAVVTQPDSIVIQMVIDDATCNAANGSISVLATGGVSPYDYAWSNGTTNQNLSNVVGGIYTLTLTDDNGCVVVQSDSVGSTSNIDGYIYATDVLCYGGTSGTALAVIESGNAPFEYDWSTGDTINLVKGLSAGAYSVHVVDAFGCEINLTTTIDEPDSLYIVLSSPEPLPGYNVSTFGGWDGSIQSMVYGGTPGFDYQWSTGQQTEDISGLSEGTYILNVTDNNGCAASASITLIGPRQLAMPEGLTPNNDLQNDFFVIKGIEAYPDNELVIYNRWGNIVYQIGGYDNTWQGENNKGEPLPDGTYFAVFRPTKSGITEPLTGYVDLRRSR